MCRGCALLTSAATTLTMCADDEPLDNIVIFGDAAALFSYGVIQAIVDVMLAPFAATDPDLFVYDVPIENPLAQGSLLTITWVAIALLSGSYKYSCTRILPGSLIKAAQTWLASSVLLLCGLALLGAAGIGPGANTAEASFIFGSATVVGGWRLVLAQAPPP